MGDAWAMDKMKEMNRGIVASSFPWHKGEFLQRFLQSRANRQNVLSKNIIEVIFSTIKVHRELSTFYAIKENDTQRSYFTQEKYCKGLKK